MFFTAFAISLLFPRPADSVIDVTSKLAALQWEQLPPRNLTQICCAHGQMKSTLIDVPEHDLEKYLKVVAVSDTHDFNDAFEQLMAEEEFRSGDVFVHAGDFTNFGDWEKLREFNALLGRLQFRFKIVVAGNHELGFDRLEDETRRSVVDSGRGTRDGFGLLSNVVYLQDDVFVVDGVKFYGMPYHFLPGFPFFVNRSEPREQRIWGAIPADTDVLITHSPPLGVLDMFNNTERWGSREMLLRVEDVKPKFHVFGHVHQTYGAVRNDHTTFINAALTSPVFPPRRLEPRRRPFVFYVPKKTFTVCSTSSAIVSPEILTIFSLLPMFSVFKLV